MTFDKAQLLVSNSFSDVRGTHKKFLGNVPANLAIESFSTHEIFMTTNKKNVIRGMHFQETAPQTKIIKVITGSLIVNAVNLNVEDPEFGNVVSLHLSADDDQRFYVPGTWALGYQALEEDTRVLYIAGADFDGAADTGIDPFDAELDLNWTINREDAILSDRDKELQTYAEFVARVKG